MVLDIGQHVTHDCDRKRGGINKESPTFAPSSLPWVFPGLPEKREKPTWSVVIFWSWGNAAGSVGRPGNWSSQGRVGERELHREWALKMCREPPYIFSRVQMSVWIRGNYITLGKNYLKGISIISASNCMPKSGHAMEQNHLTHFGDNGIFLTRNNAT